MKLRKGIERPRRKMILTLVRMIDTMKRLIANLGTSDGWWRWKTMETKIQKQQDDGWRRLWCSRLKATPFGSDGLSVALIHTVALLSHH